MRRSVNTTYERGANELLIFCHGKQMTTAREKLRESPKTLMKAKALTNPEQHNKLLKQDFSRLKDVMRKTKREKKEI